MKCKYCSKTLRKCKRIDIVRDFHFKCEDLHRQMIYEKELKDFIEWFKLKGINVVG